MHCALCNTEIDYSPDTVRRHLDGECMAGYRRGCVMFYDENGFVEIPEVKNIEFDSTRNPLDAIRYLEKRPFAINETDIAIQFGIYVSREEIDGVAIMDQVYLKVGEAVYPCTVTEKTFPAPWLGPREMTLEYRKVDIYASN